MQASRILVVLAAFAGSGSIAAAQSPPTREASAREARIRELERELRAIRDEAKELGGGDEGDAKTFRDWINNVKARKHKLEEQVRGLDETIEKLGGSIEGIDAMRKEMADAWVIGGGDVAQEGAEKVVAEAVAKRLASEGLRRLLGVASAVIDVVEYGGRKIIKEVNVSVLEDMVRRQRMTMRDVYALQIVLLAERKLAKQGLDRLEELKARFNDVFGLLAEERRRHKLLGGQATDHAVGERELDAAGDREERRKYGECARINCDCAGVDFGLLTGAYRKECRQAESALKRACNERGTIAGTCHPTASGPKAWPQ